MPITLKAARVNIGLTQEDAAKEAGVKRETLISWEKGKTAPTLPHAKRLAEIYGVKIDDFLFK